MVKNQTLAILLLLVDCELFGLIFTKYLVLPLLWCVKILHGFFLLSD